MRGAIIYFGFNDPRQFKRGVENVIFTQASAQPLLSRYYVCVGNEIGAFKWNGIACISLRPGILAYLIANVIIWKIGKKHKEGGLIIHSHNYLFSFFSVRCTDFFSVHDGLCYLKKNFGARGPKLFIFALIERIVYFRTKRIHFISGFARSQALVGRHSIGKSIVIPNTSSLESFSKTLKQEPKKTCDRFILTVRSIEERAGLKLLIDVASAMKDTWPNVNFKVAGKGPMLEFYRNQIKERNIDNIEFLGFISDHELCRLYQTCQLVLIPSLYGEGFGLPVIEGYLFNKPVIASNVCAIPEVIAEKRFLFDNRKDSVVEKIEMVFTEQFSDYRFNEYYTKNFSHQKILREYHQLYSQ